MILPAPTSIRAFGKHKPNQVWMLHWRCARSGLRLGALQTVAAASQVQRALSAPRPFQQDSSRLVDISSIAQRKPVIAGDVDSTLVTPNAQSAARSLFAALNRRDVSAVLSLLSDDVTYENLGSSTVLRGRAAVGRFYLEALAALPENAVFVLETPGGPLTDPWVADPEDTGCPVLQAGVAWRVELDGVVVPLCRGVGVYWADPRTGRLALIWDNPEHTVKQSAPALISGAWVSPLLRDWGPLVMPAALSVTSFLNNVVPGGGGSSGDGEGIGQGAASGLPPTSAGASAGGDLVGTFMSTLTSMMPFQPPTVNGVGSNSEGKVLAIGGGAGGRDGAAMFRDHTRGTMASGGSGDGLAAAAAAVAAAPTVSSAAGGAGLGAVSPMAQLADAGSWSMQPSSGSRGNGGSPGGGRPTAAERARGEVNAAVAEANNAAGGFGTLNVTARASSKEPVRMRPLPDPMPPPMPGASVSVVLSLTSLGDDDVSAAAIVTPSVTAKGVRNRTNTIASLSTPAFAVGASDNSSSVALRSGNSSRARGGGGNGGGGSNAGGRGGNVLFGSVDSGSDSDICDGGVSSAPLPFARSMSPAVDLTGLWEKDLAASQVEEYESMLDVLQLGGLQKVTARLIDGLDLRQDEQRFEVSFVTVVPFFRVTEKSLFGGITTMMRRDLRLGRQTARATRVPGGVVVRISWDAPLAGSLQEEYVTNEDGTTMAVTSNLRIGTRAAMATLVYRRSSRNKGDFLAAQRSTYGSLEDVLRSQEKKYGKIDA